MPSFLGLDKLDDATEEEDAGPVRGVFAALRLWGTSEMSAVSRAFLGDCTGDELFAFLFDEW